MLESLHDLYAALQNPKSSTPAIVLLWVVIGAAMVFLLWPRGRTLARQIYALASLGFREGLRLKVLWTVLLLSLVPGAIAFFSDADGTHAGRARLILNTCITSGELLGAALIVLLSALSVAREIESRIMHTIGAKPVPRWTILTGKALGFWAIDLCFLTILMIYSAGLVRAVPLRAETHEHSGLEGTGTWEQLDKDVLTTRIYSSPEVSGGKTAELKFIKPGASNEWIFPAPDADAGNGQRSLRFAISSTLSVLSHIPDVRLTASVPGQPPFFDRTETVPRGRPFELFLDKDKTPSGPIVVAVHMAPRDPASKYPPYSLIVSRSHGVQLGISADGFAPNLAKSFFMMAIQGWVLAIITASWSGVLSFAVTVALGVILVMSGEMSRNVIELLRSDVMRLKESGLLNESANALQLETMARLQMVLGLFPDFQAAGGPSAFVDGQYVPALAVAHAALWMGIIRGLGWALPGFIAFQRREVGK